MVRLDQQVSVLLALQEIMVQQEQRVLRGLVSLVQLGLVLLAQREIMVQQEQRVLQE